MLARAHKKFQRGQHSEIYLLSLKKQDKTKMELPLDMVSISASSCRTINDGFFWTVPGLKFDMVSTRIKTHLPFQEISVFSTAHTGAKLKGGMGGGDSPQLPISQGTGEVCRAKMSNLTCENRNTIAKYYFVTD